MREEVVHDYPLDEERMHCLDDESGACDCCPDYEFEAGGVVVVHQRFEEYVSLH